MGQFLLQILGLRYVIAVLRFLFKISEDNNSLLQQNRKTQTTWNRRKTYVFRPYCNDCFNIQNNK